MKIRLLDRLNILHDLTFLDFELESSEPIGSEQRELCSVISLWYVTISTFKMHFPVFWICLKNVCSKKSIAVFSQEDGTSSRFLGK